MTATNTGKTCRCCGMAVNGNCSFDIGTKRHSEVNKCQGGRRCCCGSCCGGALNPSSCCAPSDCSLPSPSLSCCQPVGFGCERCGCFSCGCFGCGHNEEDTVMSDATDDLLFRDDEDTLDDPLTSWSKSVMGWPEEISETMSEYGYNDNVCYSPKSKKHGTGSKKIRRKCSFLGIRMKKPRLCCW